MTNFIGEYECKMDAKGRLSFPAALRKQLSPESEEKFVVNRGIEDCLVLYQKNDWEKVTAEINKLNPYVAKNRKFIRRFNNGATPLELDGAGRVLLPKGLMGYAGLKKTVVLFAYGNKIEVWDKDKYDAIMGEDAEEFADLAEEVMGKLDGNASGDVS